jgi:hypothetical protein
MSNPEKYNNIIQYGDFLPRNYKQNLDFFQHFFRQTSIKDKVIRTTYNTVTPTRNTYNPLYYNIVEYLLSELYFTENTNTNYDLNSILTKIKNIKSLSDIDEIIHNDLYNLCITTKSQKCINIVESNDLDIYYRKSFNCIYIIFVIKNTNNTINIQIPTNKKYNPNMVRKNHVVYIMDYKQLNDKDNFLYNCINNTFSINDVSNEHITILKNTLGFHYSRNSNKHMFFSNIENILNMYIACDNIELLYSIIKSTPYNKNKNSINNLKLLKTIHNNK